jgi:tetratricopeptide (TPR) repeat protein
MSERETTQRGVFMAESIESLTKAISGNPDDWRAFFQRGSTYYREGRLVEAVEDFSRVLKLKPSYANAIKNLDRAKAGTRIMEEVYLNLGNRSHCTSLEDINVPAGVKDIGRGLFDGCDALNRRAYA